MMQDTAKQEKTLERVYRITFGSVYPLYVQKAERKGRTQDEVDKIISWLTGYDKKALGEKIIDGTDFEHFFRLAPRINPNSIKITGTVCGKWSIFGQHRLPQNKKPAPFRNGLLSKSL
jgi:hypothetical protein